MLTARHSKFLGAPRMQADCVTGRYTSFIPCVKCNEPHRPSEPCESVRRCHTARDLPYLHGPRCNWCGYELRSTGLCDRCDHVPLTPPEQIPIHDADPVPCPDTSLDTDETYVPISTGEFNRYDPGLSTTYSTFRHAGWAATRSRTARALHEVFPTGKRPGRFDTCGVNAHVYRHAADRERFQVRSEKCRDRWCVPCARERARQLAATLADHVAEKQCRFITLTLKSSQEPLKLLIDKLLQSFKELRRTILWKATQRGGAAFMEVKWNPQRDRWHPHLHILSEGKFIPQHHLKRLWFRITGDSFIVDVRLVKSRPDLCSYVTKYVTSPVSHSVTNHHDLLCEAIRALHGRRTATTFGSWRGLRLIALPESDEWSYYGSWQDLVAHAEVNPWSEERRVLAGILDGTPARPWKTNGDDRGKRPP